MFFFVSKDVTENEPVASRHGIGSLDISARVGFECR